MWYVVHVAVELISLEEDQRRATSRSMKQVANAARNFKLRTPRSPSNFSEPFELHSNPRAHTHNMHIMHTPHTSRK